MNEQNAKKQVKKYLSEYSAKYGASLSEMESIALRESSNDPLVGLHPDGISYGLLGITPIVEKEFLNMTGTLADRKIIRDNVILGCWFWGYRIPQMLKYFGHRNTLRNRVIAYNAGINYVVKQTELPGTTIAYIGFMESQKKKSLTMWGALALFLSWTHLR